MASNHWNDPKHYTGPTLEDCQKIFWTIKEELMSDVELRILMSERVQPVTRPSVVVYNVGFSDQHPDGVPRIWATKVLGDGLVAISYKSLYELLIEAHRTIEGYLSGQLPLPLP